jgi:processive 1,2-diacylglycerol beta-glucosyltransferase
MEEGYPKTYEWLIRNVPHVWAFCYYYLDNRLLGSVWHPFRHFWNMLMARKFSAELKLNQPNAIITTHFLPADVLSALKKNKSIRSKVCVVITDLHPHRFWLSRYADFFITGSDQTKKVCQKRGIPEHKLHTLGIPIGMQFSQAKDRAAILSSLGLSDSRRTLLIASGGMGVGPIEWLFKELVLLENSSPGKCQLIAVCGNNANLFTRLDAISKVSKMPVKVFGFTDIMDKLMFASDLMITKPGGLSVSEALASSLPMIFFGMIPGQEELNAKYTVARGAGLLARNKEEVITIVRELLGDSARLDIMKQKAKLAGNPNSARETVSLIMGTN